MIAWTSWNIALGKRPTDSLESKQSLRQQLQVKVSDVAQSRPTLCHPMDYTLLGILQARILTWVAFPSPGDFPNLGIEPRSSALQVDSLPAEPQGKPKNRGMGILSLLQGFFLTQESNWGLPHYSWFVYQLSYQGYVRSYLMKQKGIFIHHAG